MWKCVHISVTKSCIVGYCSDALWDLWDWSICSDYLKRVISGSLYVSGTVAVHWLWKQSLSLWANQPVIKQATLRYRIQSGKQKFRRWACCARDLGVVVCQRTTVHHGQCHADFHYIIIMKYMEAHLCTKKQSFFLYCCSVLFKKDFKQDLEVICLVLDDVRHIEGQYRDRNLSASHHISP